MISVTETKELNGKVCEVASPKQLGCEEKLFLFLLLCRRIIFFSGTCISAVVVTEMFVQAS